MARMRIGKRTRLAEAIARVRVANGTEKDGQRMRTRHALPF